MGFLRSGVPEVDASAAAGKLAEGAVAIDVRETDEWRAGRIAGALHIPMGELALRQNEIPQDRLVIAVCRSGSRSAAVTEALIGAGYRAENLAGGMHAWQAVGLPMDPPDGRVA